MFKLTCHNENLSKQLIYVLNQKGMMFVERVDENYFANIEITLINNRLNFKIKNSEISATLPISFEELFVSLKSLLSRIKFKLHTLEYSPITHQVEFNNKKIFLKDIHNIIFSSIILNYQNGIEKNSIYKKIWPIDKNIQINKLDTHLTNLKNQLKESLDYNLKFFSSKGILKLIID